MRFCHHRRQQEPDHWTADPSHELAALSQAHLLEGHGARRDASDFSADLPPRPINRCTLIRAFNSALSRGNPPGRRAMVSKLVTTGKMAKRILRSGATFMVKFFPLLRADCASQYTAALLICCFKFYRKRNATRAIARDQASWNCNLASRA